MDFPIFELLFLSFSSRKEYAENGEALQVEYPNGAPPSLPKV